MNNNLFKNNMRKPLTIFGSIFFLFLIVFVTNRVSVFSTSQKFRNSIINNFTVSQTASVVGQPIKWTKTINVSSINDLKHYLEVPSTASNVKISVLPRGEIKTSGESQQLTNIDRQKLSALAKENSESKASLALAHSIKNKPGFFATIFNTFSKLLSTMFAAVEMGTTTDTTFIDLTASSSPVADEIIATSESTESTSTEVSTSTLDLVPTEPTSTETISSTTESTSTPSEGVPLTGQAEIVSTTTEATTSTPEIVPTETTSTETISSTTEATSTIEATSTPTGTSASSTVVVVQYETPAPVIAEAKTETGKVVTVSAADTPDAPVTNVLAFTNIPEIYKVGQEDKIKIKWTNNNNENVTFKAYDLNGNGYLDYVEWTVPHLSTQTFEIIFISKAFQLDSDKNIVADIYDQVQAQDGIWASIPDTNYVRVTFDSILTNKNDNTIYARPSSSTLPVTIEVYPIYTDVNGNDTQGPLVATFPSIDHEGKYKVLLTNLQTPTDIFLFKVIGNASPAGTSGVDIDYVVDPATIPSAPTIGTAVAGNATATVAFTAPASDGGSPITGYTVTSSPSGGVDTNAGSTTLSHLITGLTNGTAYTFTVTATNIIGTSSASAASNRIYPEIYQIPTSGLVASWKFNETSGTSYSDQGTLGTISGLSWNATGLSGSSLKATSPGQYFDSNVNISTLQTISIGTWIKITADTDTYRFLGNVSGSSGYLLQYMRESGGKSGFAFALGNDGSFAGAVGSAPISVLGQWAFVVGTRTGDLAKLYINGQFAASSTLSGRTNSSASGLRFFCTPLNNYCGTGMQLDNAFVYNRALSDAEILTIYNGQVGFTIPGAPTSVTAIAGNATATVAFTAPASDGGSAITGYTVTSSPAGGVDTNAGSTTLSHLITGLTNGTAYTFTVTATNAIGTSTPSAASNSVTPVGLPSAPTIGTAVAQNTYAIVNFATSTSDGGSPILYYTATSNIGGFSATSTASPIIVTGLTNGTAYTFTVTATNIVGTSTPSATSNSVTPTVPFVNCGDNLTDSRDGKVYPTVLIGTQCWMSKNLNYDNGCSLKTWINSTDVGWCGYYSGIQYPDEGLLYQWSAAMNGSTTPGAQGICPTGWHMPTHDELTTLERAVCTSATCATDFPYDTTTTGWRGTDEGTKLMSGGTSGFNILPAGLRVGTDGTYNARTSYGYIWSSVGNGGNAWRRFWTVGANAQVYRSADIEAHAWSVRCLKNIVVTAPGAPTSVSATAGNTQATVTFTAPASDGGSAITGYTVTSSPAGGVDTNAGSTTLSHLITGLTNGTAYTFTVTATNAIGTSTASAASNSVVPASVPSAPVVTSTIVGTTGSHPMAIIVDSFGNIYTANDNSSNVSKITPEGVSSIFAITSTYPKGIAIDLSGNIYTTHEVNNNVNKITPSGVASVFATTGVSPFGIIIDSSGNIYTANAGGDVSKITPSGVSTILGTTGSNPTGITIDSSGNVYTANQNSNNVTKITPSGVSTILGTTGSAPWEVTIDSSGNIYTSNYNSDNVSKITPSGVSTILGTTGSHPTGITIDPSGNIYTSNFGTNTVSKITPSGVSTILGTTGLNPYGITIDSFGNIYTGNYTPGNVSKISQIFAVAGNSSATVSFPASLSDGGSAITSYTVTSVEDPTKTATASSSPITVTGLTNGNSYSFTVVATNAVGDSASSSVSNSVTPFISNTLPIATSVSINSGVSPIVLLPGTTTNVTCSGVVTDNDGYTNIASVTAKLYRSGVGASATDDNSNHYTLSGDTQCIPSNGLGNNETYTCTFPVQFYADPTDVGSVYDAQNWVCEMTPSDIVGAGTAATSINEVASLKSLDVSPTISYGSLTPGQNSTGDHIAVVTNLGNVATGFKLSGNDLSCPSGLSIPVGNQQYNLTSFNYGSGTPLSAIETDSGASLNKPTQSISSVLQNIYWQIAVPFGISGTCSGTISFIF